MALDTSERHFASSIPANEPEPAKLEALLSCISTFLRRYVVVTAEQTTALSLWIVHTWTFEAADSTPYIAVTSAEKRSGKTRLLEVMERLVREPLPTANISDAALFRAIAQLTPTLLLDEVDAIFGPKARDREDLRAMLNAGYRPGATVLRMGGARMTTLEAFSVFCPKVLAGIGELPDTVDDRAIRIRLERRTRDEQIQRFRRRDVEVDAETLRHQLAEFADRRIDDLRELRPHLPDELDDRAQDCWEPLLAVAELAGQAWTVAAQKAAVVLSGGDARDDESMTARLLADIHRVFVENGGVPLRTADLIEKLSEIEESPWGDWRCKPISAHALSRLLRPFRIKTMSVYAGGETVRGYKPDQFIDAWRRVLGVSGVRGVSRPSTSGRASNAMNTSGASHAGASSQRRTSTADVPLLGDSGYLDFIRRHYVAANITREEWLGRVASHARILRAGA